VLNAQIVYVPEDGYVLVSKIKPTDKASMIHREIVTTYAQSNEFIYLCK